MIIFCLDPQIFHLESADLGRSSCSGAEWREDEHWSAILDDGWDLNFARSTASDLIDRQPDALNWLDYGSEHPHRIAVSARVDVVDEFVQDLEQKLESKIQVCTFNLVEKLLLCC